jgi:hypothetical protein
MPDVKMDVNSKALMQKIFIFLFEYRISKILEIGLPLS